MTELVTITPPDETKLTAAFDALPDDLKSRLEAKFAPLIDALLTSVEAGEPTPKTGGLRGATHAFSYLRARSVGGGVAIGPESSEPFNLKAAALEHGSHKLIDMAGHAMRLDHFMNKQIEPMTVFVNAYTRRTNILALHFMRDALVAQQPAFAAAVEEAISEMADEFNR
jgi:hypothetical protein